MQSSEIQVVFFELSMKVLEPFVTQNIECARASIVCDSTELQFARVAQPDLRTELSFRHPANAAGLNTERCGVFVAPAACL